MKILACDLGGTKTLLQTIRLSGDNHCDVLHEKRYQSGDYAEFHAIIRDYLAEYGKSNKPHFDAACFAVAGPVQGDQATITNLPWHIKRQELAQIVGLPQVSLINDFQAIAYGVDLLTESDYITLQSTQPVADAPTIFVGAGTGLGVAVRVGDTVMATEGGHTPFAPLTDEHMQLWTYLHQNYPVISYEDLLSGRGLNTLFTFLKQTGAFSISGKLQAQLDEADDIAAAVSAAAANGEPIAVRTLEMFVGIYATKTMELALNTLPYGGVYLAGGIAAKNAAFFQNGKFINAFIGRGTMQHLLRQMPVRLITNQQVGVLGAAVAARLAAT